MAVLPNIVNLVGVVFLSHAVYSAYEHSLLPSSSIPPAPSSILPRALDPKINLPIDVVLETIFAVLVLCFGVVISSPALKPIHWHVWAGKLERSKQAREIQDVGIGGGNPYATLEDRPGFLDIRDAQKGFASWMKGSGSTKTSL